MKKRKQSISEGANKKPKVKKINPFEVHVNRKKYDILGVKLKSERGLPGISRSRSLKKRKGTLLQEYKFKDKKNLFLDRRIGEKNSAMTAEDKILARYTAERMKFHSKKSIYNLGDDEELTHKGQTLTEIEKFDNPKSDDDDDDEEDGKLNSDFVGDAHFGGGIFKKVEGETKSRKDLIDQLIAESMKRKAEKQKLRQQTLDLTEKLDSEWKELLPLVTESKKSKLDPEPVNKKNNEFANYDVLSKKLKFEARGKPCDRLKSEEEIAKEEKEKLEMLERERIQRMMGETNSKSIKHRSADDMDDGFELDDENETFLTYKDGVLESQNNIEYSNFDSKNEVARKLCESNGDLEANESDDNEDNESNNNDEEEDEDKIEEVGNGDGDNDDDDDNNDDDDDDGDDDNFSDLKENDESSDEELEKKIKPNEENESKTVETKEEISEKIISSAEKDAIMEAKQKAKEIAEKELPYTFDIPKEYEEFEKLMRKYEYHYQYVIVERMIKCHHPSLKEEHKEDLYTLYTFLLQYIQDCASENSSKTKCFEILDGFAPWLYDLTQWNPQHCAAALMEVIREKYQDFLKNPKIYPTLDTIIFLKLVSLLFPTSDFRHPVVTPTLVFMEQIIFQCKVQSSVDLSIGLFITTLILEFCLLSKRFVPEAVNFVYGVLTLAHPKDSDIPVRLPFKKETMEVFNLNIHDKSRDSECSKLSIRDLIYRNSKDEFKINALHLTLNLLSKFCDFWVDEPSAILIFQPFFSLLDVNVFSYNLKKDVEEVLEKLSRLKKEDIQMLTLEKKKPKPLRLYEPKFEEVNTLKKYRPMGKKKAERAKLIHKYKKEMKGALREIRRDRAFLAKLKFREAVKSDMERQRKVREILGSAAEQAGELRKLQKKKK